MERDALMVRQQVRKRHLVFATFRCRYTWHTFFSRLRNKRFILEYMQVFTGLRFGDVIDADLLKQVTSDAEWYVSPGAGQFRWFWFLKKSGSIVNSKMRFELEITFLQLHTLRTVIWLELRYDTLINICLALNHYWTCKIYLHIAHYKTQPYRPIIGCHENYE